ncbi:MAG TPA: TetR/AcrR family transcriptional regulator [Steroidobacter sp.]|jgi:AcrR family transcriptional regulator|nr:TetR/AcrR family transcriptional regulator [Steroidobacter sp.]
MTSRSNLPATALGRRLNAAQADRRAQLIAAARALAGEGGYEAVTISALCEHACVARATFYHYFGSKDHVLGEAIVQWGRERMAELRRRPPTGRTPYERTVGTLRWVLDAVLRDSKLIEAHVQSMVSPDLGVGSTQRELASLVTGYLEVGLGPAAASVDVAALSMVLSHVFFSSLVNMTAGRASAEAVFEDLTLAARLVLEPSSRTAKQQQRATV